MALANVLKPQFITAKQYNPCLQQEEYVGELSELRQQASWLDAIWLIPCLRVWWF